MRRWLTIVAAVWVLAAFPAEAKRVALVIGNDAYTTLPRLNNATADAEGMAAKLKSLGFDVILKTNAGRRDMYRAVDDFSSRLAAGDTALVFYAGHGVQADGRNYLIPANAAVEVEADLPAEALTANRFLVAMADAGVGLSVMILDACRDNPLPKRKRSASRGLTIVSAPQGAQGSAIIYSAGPGQTAEDGPMGGHGVFTGALLSVLDRPNLKLEDVFKETARVVAQRTRNKQMPWMNASLTGDFYFREGAVRPVQAAVPPAAVVDKEVVFWQSIQNSADPAMFEAYLKQYPSGTFALLAEAKVKALPPTRTASLTRVPEKPAALPSPSQAGRNNDAAKVSAETPITPLKMVVVSAVTARAAPGLDGRKVAEVPVGAEVVAAAKVRSGGSWWYRVALPGKEGAVYVFGRFLVARPENFGDSAPAAGQRIEPRTVAVRSITAVYNAPGKTARKLGEFWPGREVTIAGKAQAGGEWWYEATLPGGGQPVYVAASAVVDVPKGVNAPGYVATLPSNYAPPQGGSSCKVSIKAPDIAENGAVVPVEVTLAQPLQEGGNLTILTVEGSAVFVEADRTVRLTGVSTRVRLPAGVSEVRAFLDCGNGAKAGSARSVKTTIGGLVWASGGSAAPDKVRVRAGGSNEIKILVSNRMARDAYPKEMTISTPRGEIRAVLSPLLAQNPYFGFVGAETFASAETHFK